MGDAKIQALTPIAPRASPIRASLIWWRGQRPSINTTVTASSKEHHNHQPTSLADTSMPAGSEALLERQSGSCSSSSIGIWLNNHPNEPEGYIQPPYQEDCAPRLRKRQPQLQGGRSKSSTKRPRLAEIVPNGAQKQLDTPRKGQRRREEKTEMYMAKPTPSGCQGSEMPEQRRSPRKERRDGHHKTKPTPSTSQKNGISQHQRSPRKEIRARTSTIYLERTPSPSLQDEEDTTPTRNRTGPIPKLHPTARKSHHNTASTNESPRPLVPSEGSIQSASSARSVRSRSPVKAMGDLSLTEIRVSIKLFGTNKRTLPPDAQHLYNDLRRVAQAKYTIPKAFRDKVVAISEEADLSEDTFAPTNGLEDARLTNEPLSLEIFWASIIALREASLECDEECLSEAAWNANVHAAIIRLALSGYWKKKGVWYHDITSARISDATLLPTVATGTTQSKMVDLSFYVHRDAGLEGNVLEKCVAKNTRSISQTMVEYARFTPLSVSIETKRGALGESEAHLQLALWVSAHYAKLRQLTRVGTEMPLLPLLKVQGHDWKFMLAEQVDDGQIVMLKELRLGSTDSIQGIFQVIAALRRLALWTDEVYKPWFDQYVLSTHGD